MFEIHVSRRTGKKRKDTLDITELTAELGRLSTPETQWYQPQCFLLTCFLSHLLYPEDLILTSVLQFNHLCQGSANTQSNKFIFDKLKWVISSSAVRTLIGNGNLRIEDKVVTRSNHWKLKVNKCSAEQNSGFCIKFYNHLRKRSVCGKVLSLLVLK